MEETTTSKSLALVNQEITKELADPHIVKALLATTFKDFDEKLMRQAIFEGVIRGFAFKNFLQKDVFAIKYHDNKKGVDTYSLVTSIDYARKLGMRNGVIGKSAPSYTFMDDSTSEVETCSVTIKRRVVQDVGEFTATVYFSEYSTGRNLWASKPRTMIAKVAEMHALRMACPEELAKVYTEEEFDKEHETQPTTHTVVRTQHEEDEGERPNLIIHQNNRSKQVDDETAADLEDNTN
jgi:hypothetical protein